MIGESISRNFEYGSIKYMRGLFGILCIFVFVFALISCDSIDDFGDINEDPTEFTDIDSGQKFTNIQLDVIGDEDLLIEYDHAGAIVQSVARVHAAFQFYASIREESAGWFPDKYAQLKNIEDLITQLESMAEEGEQVDNKLAATRILRVSLFHTLTDLYGDVPYFEAGKALQTENFTPSYDPQSEIYSDMLNELAEAVEQFDTSQPTFGSQDIMYGGDITRWQKFGNSLRLRLALRLVEIDPQMAQEEAIAALNASSGVMTSNDDMAYIAYPGTPHESESAGFIGGGGNYMYLGHALVEWMKTRDDPRLSIYAAIMEGQGNIDEAPGNVVSTDPADQLGFPAGYGTSQSTSLGFGPNNISQHPSYSVAESQSPTEDPLDGYSKLNPVLWRRTAPRIFQSYAEVELMRAEMAARDWTSEDAETHYNEGVRAAMTYLSVYNDGEGTTVTDAQVDEYLADNPYDPSNAIEQINEQYWIATFKNFLESWANFRRSGYPDLEPAMIDSPEWPPVNNTGDQWPQRLLYPGSERDNNRESLEEAENRQGLDGSARDVTVPVWWDAEPPLNQ